LRGGKKIAQTDQTGSAISCMRPRWLRWILIIPNAVVNGGFYFIGQFYAPLNFFIQLREIIDGLKPGAFHVGAVVLFNLRNLSK
jgi:hypothetical protein